TIRREALEDRFEASARRAEVAGSEALEAVRERRIELQQAAVRQLDGLLQLEHRHRSPLADEQELTERAINETGNTLRCDRGHEDACAEKAIQPLQPRRRVDDIADGAVLPARARADVAEQHRSRVDADPRRQLAVHPPPIELLDGREDLERSG